MYSVSWGTQDLNKDLEPQSLSQGRLQKTGDGAVLPTEVWSWWTPQGRSRDFVHHSLSQPHPGQPGSLKSKGREGQGALSGVTGSRLKGTQKPGGSSPSQTGLHPPKLGATGRAGWPCPGSLCLPQAQESLAGKPCSGRKEIITYNDSKAGHPEPRAVRNLRKQNSPKLGVSRRLGNQQWPEPGAHSSCQQLRFPVRARSGK